MNKKSKLMKLKKLAESVKATKAKLEKAKALHESIRPSSIRRLLEAELEQAEVILAAKDFTEKLQKMAEDLANMQAESIPLGDSMKETFGPEASQDFENAVTQAMQEGLAAIRKAKDEITNSIMRVEGGKPETDIGVDNDMTDSADDEDEGNEKLNLDDGFGGADAAAGKAEEPLGRGMKESLSSYGKRILMRESLDSLVSWLMEDVSVSMPATQLPKFAGQIAARSAKNPEALAGWIGQRKYGKGAAAQLSNPIDNDDILDEGKSYRRSEDDEDENIAYKKKSSVEREKRAKAKRSIEETVRRIIDRNISQTGKGLAAKAIAEAQSLFPMLEANYNIAEAFEAAYGMTPQAYSLKKAKLVREAALNQNDKKNAAEIMTKIAGEMGKDKNMSEKPVSTALSKLDNNERSAAQKVINTAKANGKKVDKVSDLIDATKDELGESYEDDPNGGYVGKVRAEGVKGLNSKPFSKVFKNGKEFLAWFERNEGDIEIHRVSDESSELIGENINAAHWPIAPTGQYKGEPFQTDYNKLKQKSTTQSDSVPVNDTPKSDDTSKSKMLLRDESKAKDEAESEESTENKED